MSTNERNDRTTQRLLTVGFQLIILLLAGGRSSVSTIRDTVSQLVEERYLRMPLIDERQREQRSDFARPSEDFRPNRH
jgi:hypothetical protein